MLKKQHVNEYSKLILSIFTTFSTLNVRLTESLVWYRNYFHTGTVSCWSKKFKFILYSASKQSERNSFHHFLYYRTLTTACFSYFSNKHVLFLQILQTVDRVGPSMWGLKNKGWSSHHPYHHLQLRSEPKNAHWKNMHIIPVC